MARVFPQDGHLVMESDTGHVLWSSALRPVNLLPDEFAIVLEDFEIEFPEFEKRFWYGYGRAGPGNSVDGCVSLLSLRPGDYDLPDIDLGALPEGVNYLDVRVNLTRTVSPVGLGTVTMQSEVPAGKTVFLPGGSCNIERFAYYRRVFHIVIEDGHAVLKRRQSVNKLYRPFVPLVTTNYTANGFSTGGGDLANHAPVFAVMEQKSGGNATNERRRGGNNQCRMDVENFNTRSVYKGTVTIRPGYIECVGEGCAVNGGRTLSVERDPESGWRYSTTPPSYSWMAQSAGGYLNWNAGQLGIGIASSETEFYHTDGWIYMRGPVQTDFGGGTIAYRIARRRETIIPPS